MNRAVPNQYELPFPAFPRPSSYAAPRVIVTLGVIKLRTVVFLSETFGPTQVMLYITCRPSAGNGELSLPITLPLLNGLKR